MSAPEVQQLLLDGKADAYLEWGLKTDFRFLGKKKEPIGLLLKWATKDIANCIEDAEKIQEGLDFSDVYKTKSICALAIPASDMVTFLTQTEPRIEAIELSSAIVVRTEAEQLKEEADDLERALAAGREAPSYSNPARPRSEVLLALLDDSCAFANSRFLSSDGPRVWFLWDQNEHSNGVTPTSRSGPTKLSDFRYGGQWCRQDFATALDAAQGDEDLAYHAAGVSGLRRRATHGTHVMDLLAGGLEKPIVAVQFPSAGIEDSSGRWLSRHVLDGLHYVIQCAHEDTRRIVANISWGPQTGPHDGSALLEEAIDDLVEKDPRLEVVFPAGNSFSSRAHGSARLSDGCKGLEWVVPPDGKSPAFLEIWWPPGIAPEDVELTVEAPDGTGLTVTGRGFVAAPEDRWSITLIKARKNGAMALVAINPTGGAEGSCCGRHGIWRVTVEPLEGVEDLHMYIARADHDMGARRRARSSHLNDACYGLSRFRAASERDSEAPGSIIQRAGTLNGAATGARCTLAAGYLGDDQTRRPAPYSSSGPARGGTKDGPDAAYQTDYSLGVRGIRASGVRSGTTVRLVGTSMAAPQRARELALQVVPARGAAQKQQETVDGSAPSSEPVNPAALADRHRIGGGYRPALAGKHGERAGQRPPISSEDGNSERTRSALTKGGMS
ncbi:hypothetical protein [Variovorax ginsengisoli]|uniref:Peptidase S8/S53 domain-containing protein n=1 Tax=Variovorax ginsengisoli TaxID=363844 RepID=A0ABT8S9Y2_9BURK|nr:hypothetical protein [Variovorax ginsengisoli]MDN8616078.1 hypothetical protein [Variovorax ginsengisoli]MDO1535248.1 hypothetical protein [Variovorax ginsengisoli]